MSLKEQILQHLEDNEDEYLSGEQLAGRFGVTRSSVWKAVNALRKDGFIIEASTNRGYRLNGTGEQLSEAAVSKYISAPGSWNIIVRSEVGSTNNVAKELALKKAPHGTVIIADRQTAGRGRQGKTFESPAGTGIYMSIIMRPDADMGKATLITTAAAVGVCRAIRDLAHVPAKIKWVNDIYLGEKKLCGILTEAVTDFESGSLESVVVGIGINYRRPSSGFSREVEDRGVCTLYGCDEKAPVSRNELAARVIDEVLAICENLDDKSFLQDYRKWSAVIGKDITYTRAKQQFKARALDIGENGGLIVLKPDGTQEELISGEISVRW